MTQHSLPGCGYTLASFTCPPDFVIFHPEIDSERTSGPRTRIILAMCALAEDEKRAGTGDGYSTGATREQICKLARCGATSFVRAMRWYRSIDAIDTPPAKTPSGRGRIYFTWRRLPSKSAPEARAPARARARPSARLARPPARAPHIERVNSEGERSVPSSNPPPAPTIGPPKPPGERVRDGYDSPPKGGRVPEGEGRRKRALQLRLALGSEHGIILMVEGGRVARRIPPYLREDRERLEEILTPTVKAELEALEPELLEILSMAAGRVPPQAPGGGAAPRKVWPDEGTTLPYLLGLVERQADPVTIAAAMGRRYRDPNPVTLACWVAAATTLGPDELCGYLKEAEGKDDPARWLSKHLGAAMKSRHAAKVGRARGEGCLASDPTPRPGEPEPPSRATQSYHAHPPMSRGAV